MERRVCAEIADVSAKAWGMGGESEMLAFSQRNQQENTIGVAILGAQGSEHLWRHSAHATRAQAADAREGHHRLVRLA
jgi:hypothetical protein